ncbi:Flp pilus assembly protein TadG [Rhodoblastus acidophilus]|uniref:TadE/TadG family type IV pilus assembly protein n=1 Tax=Rhodoblastus acidophilus TaxID=1074 RepID=UPI002224CBF7|nr:TadE/TadG family type IV pilus assembly protein [Rhodoblastus acidophilus]MCW2317492.1 Flp pilus assembly protein TadG [Rhodoblastus acidophilus]
MLKSFAALLRRFRRNDSGNVFILTALAILPLVGLVGLAMDYSSGLTARSQLDGALDAAVISAIATTTAEIQNGVTANTAIADGQAQGLKDFKSNAGKYGILAGQTPAVTVAVDNQNINGTGSYQATIPLNFGKLFNLSSYNVNGSARSTLKMPQYLDFYVMVDVSASMGAAATSGEQARLAKKNPDQKAEYPTGCTLACHFTTYKACDGKMCQGFILTRANGDITSICKTAGDSSPCIQLRLDAIGVAMTNLLQEAKKVSDANAISNEFRIGIYPFIVHMNGNYQPISNDLTGVVTNKANGIPSLLDTGDSTGVNAWDGTHMGSGGTNINNALNEMYSKLPTTQGTGLSASSTKPFVFLITDGAQDNQIMYNSAGSWSGSNHATTLTPSYCTTLKTRATLAILYVPYVKITNPNPNFAGDEDGYANKNIPNIAPSLQSCATPGQYYTAETPEGINAALLQMFANALQIAPRLTN